MARLPRFTIENGNYHLISRGHNQRKVFHLKEDFLKYLGFLLECKKEFQWKIYHYGLMDNHLHLVLNSPTGAALSNGMRKLNQTYAQYYRKKYGGIGYLWQDRFKSFLIQDGRYLLTCGRYVELNPLKAGIVEDPKDYPWSSYCFYAFGEKNELLDVNPEYCALAEDELGRRKKYRDFVRDGIKERRSLERYFRQGVFGDKNFTEKFRKLGLRHINFRKGRPRKEKF